MQLCAEKLLILMTDIEGVLEDKKFWVSDSDQSGVQEDSWQGKVTGGGMIPKIESAVQTVLSGVVSRFYW